jgi:hypothetical protein
VCWHLGGRVTIDCQQGGSTAHREGPPAVHLASFPMESPRGPAWGAPEGRSSWNPWQCLGCRGAEFRLATGYSTSTYLMEVLVEHFTVVTRRFNWPFYRVYTAPALCQGPTRDSLHRWKRLHFEPTARRTSRSAACSALGGGNFPPANGRAMP